MPGQNINNLAGQKDPGIRILYIELLILGVCFLLAMKGLLSAKITTECLFTVHVKVQMRWDLYFDERSRSAELWRIGSAANACDFYTEAFVVVNPIARAQPASPIIPSAASQNALTDGGDGVGPGEPLLSRFAELVKKGDGLFTGASGRISGR